MPFDVINKPAHYEEGRTISPIDVLTDWRLNYHAGNMLKYLSRWRKKDGLQDLEKLRWYARHMRSAWDRQPDVVTGAMIAMFGVAMGQRTIRPKNIIADWQLTEWEAEIVFEIYFIGSEDTQSSCDKIIQIVTDQLTAKA